MASQESTKLSASSSHRLPTVSASQALQKLKSRSYLAVSTGIDPLNKVLAPHGTGGTPASRVGGGMGRGQLTEVYGPPGVGKTAFAMQAAVNALRAGGRVVWIDGAAPLVARRLEELLSAPPTDETPSSIPSTAPKLSSAELRNRFHHYKPSTLAHLLALIIHPPSSFPPPDTSLIVIDSLSTLFDNAYPRNADDRSTRNKNDAVRWAAGRKFAVLNDLSSALRKTAALHNNSVLLTCQTITRMRSGARALLLPAMSGGDWDSGISTRLVLFRDWLPVEGPWSAEDDDRMRRARFIGVVKANGVSLAGEGGVGRVIPFTIETAGLHDLNLTTADITPQPQPQTVGTSLAQAVRPPKRAFAEIADSEDEEDGPDSDQLYGWAEDDDVAAEGLLIIEQQPSAPAVPPSHTAQGADAAAGRSEMPAG